jgi:hypothetical protein
MKAIYETRVEDLTPADHLNGDCRCGHSERLTGAMLVTAGVQPTEKLMDTERRLRCRECDAKEHVFVTVYWHDAPP